jgi:hypothetical protein
MRLVEKLQHNGYIILCLIDPLLGNDLETRQLLLDNYQRISGLAEKRSRRNPPKKNKKIIQQQKGVFSTWSVSRCYKQGTNLELGHKYKRLQLGGGQAYDSSSD